ncbi:hypothetical protein N2152v2_007993 [Parachlorella kessleri]
MNTTMAASSVDASSVANRKLILSTSFKYDTQASFGNSKVALAQASLSRHSSWKLLAVRPEDQPAPSQAFSEFPFIPAAAPTAPVDHCAQHDLTYLLASAARASSADYPPVTEASGCPSSESSCASITSCTAPLLDVAGLLSSGAHLRSTWDGSEPEPSTATADTVADSCDAMAATQPASISSDSDTWTMQYWMWCADAAAALGKPRTYAACV